MTHKLFLLFCLYLPFQVALNPAEGIDLASGRVFALILVLIWLISGLKNRRIFIPNKIQTALLLSFLFLSAFSLFWAENLNWGIRKLLFLLSIFPIYFVAGGLLKSRFNKTVVLSDSEESRRSNVGILNNEIPRQARNDIKIIKFLVWGAGIAAGAGIIQFLSQFIIGLDSTAGIWRNYITPLFLGKTFSQAVLEYPSWLVNIGGRDFLRAFSTFPDPHMFSFYLEMMLPFSLAIYYLSKRKIYLVFSAIILLADLLTFSRGGYIGLIAGLIFILIWLTINKKILPPKILVYFVLIFVVFASLAFTPVGKRFYASFSASEGSNKGRFENWNQAADMIKNNPQGVGIGNYSYEIEPSADYRKPIYAHNLYLDIAAEIGIINAIIFILLIAFSIKDFIKKSKNNILYLGGAASLVIFSIHSIFDTPLYSVQVLPLILIVIALSATDDYTLNLGR